MNNSQYIKTNRFMHFRTITDNDLKMFFTINSNDGRDYYPISCSHATLQELQTEFKYFLRNDSILVIEKCDNADQTLGYCRYETPRFENGTIQLTLKICYDIENRVAAYHEAIALSLHHFIYVKNLRKVTFYLFEYEHDFIAALAEHEIECAAELKGELVREGTAMSKYYYSFFR